MVTATNTIQPAIGVLALQGDVDEHIRMLNKLEVAARKVKLPEHIDGLDGLIIPGGESTTIAKLIDMYNLRSAIQNAAANGMALWGTCAGAILMCNEVECGGLNPLNVMDISVRRNHFGRQLDSFETDIQIEGITQSPFKAIFIRAPVITRIGRNVKAIATLRDGTVVGVMSGARLVTAFHPELTEDTRMHRLFLDLATTKENKDQHN